MTRIILSFLLLFNVTAYSTAQKVTTPIFPGGREGLERYLEQQTSVYPALQQQEAWAAVTFFIDEKGVVLLPKVTSRSAHNAAIDSAALTIVRQMPAWTPGSIHDIPHKMVESAFIRWHKGDDVGESLPIMENTGNTDNSLPTMDITELSQRVIVEEEEPDTEKPFVAVEEMPSFPGGEAEMVRFVSENLQYPEIALKNNISGRVTVRFIVNENGRISDPEVLRGLDPSCDSEAIRLVKSFPVWNPGKQYNKAVKVYFIMPITFKPASEGACK